MLGNNASRRLRNVGVYILVLFWAAILISRNLLSLPNGTVKIQTSPLVHEPNVYELDIGLHPVGHNTRCLVERSENTNQTLNVTDFPEPKEKPFWSPPYTKAQSKGCQLHSLLMRIRELGDNEYASRFTNLNNLAYYGWTNTPVNMGSGIQQLLQSVRVPLASINVDSGNTQNVNVESKHDGHGGTYQGTATGGMYFEVYNAEQGAIVAYRNYGPAYITSHNPSWNNKPLPALRQWSDVVFLTWMSMTTTEERENLRYVMRLMVMNEDTQDIVSEALRNDGVQSGVPPAWPGHTFSPGNNGGRGLKPFQAVLGTPNISGVAWMLINHRDELKYRTIESITVWDKSGMENQDAGFLLCMLVRLGQG